MPPGTDMAGQSALPRAAWKIQLTGFYFRSRYYGSDHQISQGD
ncbi:hypothetical protein CLOM621_06467 [Clostridium sp. M62/1]|nr:hypothetical protein CLOM621_06467 [Clostridium sp. M62/1]